MDLLSGEFRIELRSPSPPSTAKTEVQVIGKINATTSLALQEALELAIEPGGHLVVDLGAVEFLDSAGITALMAAAARIRNVRGQLWLKRPTPTVRRLIGFLSLGDTFPIVDQSATRAASTNSEVDVPRVGRDSESWADEAVRHLFAAALAVRRYRLGILQPEIGNDIDELTEELDSTIRKLRRAVFDQTFDRATGQAVAGKTRRRRHEA